MGTNKMQLGSILMLCISVATITSEEKCNDLQYLELYHSGVIQCSFEEGYLGILWYNSTVQGTSPIVTYVRDQKGGTGYLSGEYDVYANGSLLINNVTVSHDRVFSVSVAPTEDSPVDVYPIRIETIVKPVVSYPVIENCEDQQILCYVVNNQSSTMKCYVRNVRPEVSPLIWSQRFADQDRLLSSKQNVTQHNVQTFSSLATTKPPSDLSLLSVLVCKADTNHWLLEEEALVILESNYDDLMVFRTKYYSEHHSTLTLPCPNGNIVVWKHSIGNGAMDVIAIGIRNWKDSCNQTYNDNIALDGSGSLVLRWVDWHQAGVYMCLSTDRTADHISINEVTIFENPNPPYLVVEGCSNQQFCVRDVEREGNVTCSVHGIRPKVDLQWRSLNDEEGLYMNTQKITSSERDKHFDISITAYFRFKATFEERVTLECNVVGTNSEMFDFSTKIELLPKFETHTYETPTSPQTVLIVLLCLGAVGLIFVLLIIGFAVRRKLGDRRGSNDNEETVPMLATGKGKEAQFIKELRARYKVLYDAVQPIPYLKDRMYCVNNIFVQGGIEVLDISSDQVNQIWQPVLNYHDIVNRLVTSHRQVIEGEPGYGKSMIALQFAYDWCNRSSTSPLRKVKILIFLRLRQLRGVDSIYEAIRTFILPKDTALETNDVKSIITNCSSVVVLLDGYDEYPDQNNLDTDVALIIQTQMLQSVPVMITTRSFYLLKDIAPQTERIRLTGFNEVARDLYIQKAVVGSDIAEAERITFKLQQNPVLGDLCQVPLFFVMFAHMTHESKDFETFKSVTGFFRYMISCFHSHMRKKISDADTTRKSEELEERHDELNKVAFESLSREIQIITWKSAELRTRLGNDFYEQYIKIGILVEEEVLVITDSELVHIQYQTYVRFYHKLFCEWYAAHYIGKSLSSDVASSNSSTGEDYVNDFLRNMDPFNLQYLYRFACGLNKVASEKIIRYLQTNVKEQRFAILCILEQENNSDPSEIIKQVVSNPVKINYDDSMLLQRSTLQILDFATKKELPISCLHLKRPSLNFQNNTFELISGLTLPKLTTVDKIIIETHKDTGAPRTLDKNDVQRMFLIGMESKRLQEIVLDGCLLPLPFPVDAIPKDMRSRGIKVSWRRYGYCLNLLSGDWEVDDIKTLRRLCSDMVELKQGDDKLLQTCTLQLLAEASHYNVTISDLWLRNVFSGVDAKGITLRSNLRLTCPLSVEKIWVEEDEQELKKEDIQGILMFVLQSKQMKELIFYRGLVPQILSGHFIPPAFKSRNIKVTWNRKETYYLLDQDSGCWTNQRNGEVMTTGTYTLTRSSNINAG